MTPDNQAPALVTIPTLTLWQPWACLVEIGAKPYETRSFRIPARLLGKRVAFHAAARKPRYSDFNPQQLDALYNEFGCGWHDRLPRSVIVCTAILAESIPAEDAPFDFFGNYDHGRWAWRLDDVRPIEPHVPATGKQMIGWPWQVPEGIEIEPTPAETAP